MQRKPDSGRAPSVFEELGARATIERLVAEIRDLYTADDIPWVVGYSGGKDSTAVLSLVWRMLESLPKEARRKTVHVISTDTRVENPVVSAWVTRSLELMRDVAARNELPVVPSQLKPDVRDTFWVNLIGKGYPAPRPKFRWCTERLKIKPSNSFVNSVVRERGEVILVLGTRKAESQARAKAMVRAEKHRVRDRLSPNASLPNSLVYTPIEDWSNDDVWLFLMQMPNPWGYNNKDLLTMYQGASADGECPLVVDSSTPSCGDSRFGCWVCTLVERDKSMAAMIQNDEEKSWMAPLLELRNELDEDDRDKRDFRRMNGLVQLHKDKPIPGPYTQAARDTWLRRVLEVQEWVRRNGPEHVRQIDLISLEELEEIRRIWVVEKHELEDRLPKIYAQATGRPFPGRPLEDNPVFSAEDLELLREACGDQGRYELARDLLDVVRQHRAMARRLGLFDELEKSLRRHFYEGAKDATDFALKKDRAKKDAREEAARFAQIRLIGSDEGEAPEGSP